MPEVEVVIAEVKESVKSGKSEYGDWTLNIIKDGNNTDFSVFTPAKDAIWALAKNSVGKRMRVTYDEKNGKKNVTELAGPISDNGDAPQPGTGDYVKGKENPATQRSIAAAVALKEAVASRSDGTGEQILARADGFYKWLMNKANNGVTPPDPPPDPPAPDDDIPF